MGERISLFPACPRGAISGPYILPGVLGVRANDAGAGICSLRASDSRNLVHVCRRWSGGFPPPLGPVRFYRKRHQQEVKPARPLLLYVHGLRFGGLGSAFFHLLPSPRIAEVDGAESY